MAKPLPLDTPFIHRGAGHRGAQPLLGLHSYYRPPMLFLVPAIDRYQWVLVQVYEKIGRRFQMHWFPRYLDGIRWRQLLGKVDRVNWLDRLCSESQDQDRIEDDIISRDIPLMMVEKYQRRSYWEERISAGH